MSSDAPFREAFEESPVPTYVWRHQDGDFVCEAANRAGRTFSSGFNVAQGQLASELFRDHPAIIAAMRNGGRDEADKAILHHTFTDTGKRRTAQIVIATAHSDHLILYIRDAAPQPAAASLRDEDQSRRMIELSPDAILVHAGGRIVFVNEAAVRLLGATSRDEIVGQPALAFVHPDYQSLVGERLEVLHERPAVPLVVEKFVRLDGTIVDVEVAAIALDYEGTPAVEVIARDIGERVRQETALKHSEERFRGLVEAASEAIYRITLDGKLIEVNSAAMRITGWTIDELVGRDFISLIAPEDRQRASETFLIARHRPVVEVLRLLTRSGELAYLETTTTPEFESGKVISFFGMARDITEERRSMAETEARERLLSTVLEQLPIGVVIADREGAIVRSNPAADEIFHHHRDRIAAVSGETYWARWAVNGQEIKPDEWASARALRNGETSLNELIEIETFDGLRKTILNSAVPLRENGEIRGVLILNQDVTQQRETARQREALATRLSHIISATTDGICTIDRDGSVTLLNPAASAMLACTEDEAVGRNFHLLAHGFESEADPFARVLELGEPRPLFADRFHRSTGESFDAEVSCSPIVIEGAARGAVIAFRDVTLRNELEEELESSRRLAGLGQLAATIAHEFNNVMMGIMPFMEVITRRSKADDQIGVMATHVNRALARAKEITSGILKFAQASAPDLQPLAVRTLFESAAEELQAIAGRDVIVSIAPPPPEIAVLADVIQMHQILSNLVANARDAMPRGGTMHIDVSTTESGDHSSGLRRSRPETGYVHIRVRDHGVGMNDMTLARMFEPLFTTKRSGGTGLGLAVVQQIVSRHAGQILAESAPGKGTTFHLYIPRCAAPSPEVTTPPSEQVRHGLKRVLLIEDDESVSAGLEAILGMEGIAVRIVPRGSEAVAAVEEFRPDAVVLDRGLPDMDGTEVCRTLIARWPDLPIVFSTGHGSRSDLRDLLNNPRIGYLLKPYDVNTLLQVLERLLHSRTPASLRK
jgi:two-component system cell cycle sensor histidine kinase/response regulator CckA